MCGVLKYQHSKCTGSAALPALKHMSDVFTELQLQAALKVSAADAAKLLYIFMTMRLPHTAVPAQPNKCLQSMTAL